MKALIGVMVLALAVPVAAQDKSKKADKKPAPATGAAKGEALGRMAILQQLRGMPEAAATTQAATAADPQGVWPAIAQARQLAREGKGDEAIVMAQKVASTGGPAASSALGYAQEA